MKLIDFGNQEEFIKNYLQLKSSRKMAELYHCSKSTILNYAKTIGYDNSKNKELKITNIPIDLIINDYEELLSCKKVGEKYNCSATAVRNYLIANNYNLENHNNKLSNINIDEFITNYEELKSAKRMAQLYNCSTTAILNFAKKINYDVNTNKKYKLSENDKLYIVEHYNDLTSTLLANQFNVSRGMITKLWYDYNLLGKNVEKINTTEIDITGLDFGFWHVIEKSEKRNPAGVIYWHCKCKCGIEKDVLGTALRQHLSLSCGNHNNVSKGNYKISLLLLTANISFETEKKFSTCVDKTYLPFDFYVNNLYLIEYDGIQHFQEGLFDFEYTHKHDLIKNQWCKNNNIPLIRIPYTHYSNLCLDDLLLDTTSFLI